MSVILQHPAAAPTLTIMLPNPEFGDAERPTYGNVFGNNRNGGLLNVFDAGHPVTVMREYRCRKITKDLRDDLQNFLQISAGDVVKVTDYNSVVFNALVTNEIIEYITIRSVDCDNEVALQLMEVD